jgi:hypothetical protein
MSRGGSMKLPTSRCCLGFRTSFSIGRHSGGAGIHERRYIALMIPRGCGKTVCATKSGSLWSHLDEPNLSTAIGAEDHELAKIFFRPIKDVMKGTNPSISWFSWLYGNWYQRDRTWDEKEAIHSYRRNTALSEPSFGTFGVDTGITGMHPNQVWFDDPITINKLAQGGNWIRKAIRAHQAVDPALLTDGLYGLVLTRYEDGDVAGTALRDEGIASWSGMPPTDSRMKVGGGEWHVYFMQGRNTRDTEEFPRGRPMFPRIWSDKKLTRYEDTKPGDYAAQIQNDPTSGEHMALTAEQVDDLYFDRAKFRDIPIEYATLHVDTAFKEDQIARGDFSVINVVLHDMRDNGIVYLDKVWTSNSARVDQFNDQLINILRDLKRRNIRVRAITDEPEPGGKRGSWKMLIEQAIAGAGLRIPEIIQITRQGTKKILRLKTAAGYWAEGYFRILVPFDQDGKPIRDADPGVEAAVQEMLRIGKSYYDDISDALADVWHSELWRRPQYLLGADPNEGMPVTQPGDDALKSFGKPVSYDEMTRLYDEQNPYLSPVGRDEEDFLPPRGGR